MANPVTIAILNVTLPEIPDFPSLEDPNFEAAVKNTCDGIDLTGDKINSEFKTQLNEIIGQINQNITWMNENLAVFVAVGNDITKVITVADNIVKVTTVADNIANITSVANSIENVNNVGGNITKVTTVADNIQAILNLETIKDKIVSVEEIKGQIESVGNNISKVVIASDNIDKIGTIVQNIDNVKLLAVQADNIETIATNITALLDLSNNIDTLINAKNETLAAKDTTIQARDEAITAKNTAIEAKNIITSIILYKGVWSDSETYNKDEIVRFGDSFYVSLQNDNINHNPAQDADYWAEFSGGSANLPDKTGKAGYFLSVTENEQEVEWKSLILPTPAAQTNWNMDEETTLEIPIINYNSDFSYVLDIEIGSAFVNSEGKIVYSPGNVPDTKNYYIKIKATKRGFFDSDWLTIWVNIQNLQLPTPQLSSVDRISHLEQAVFNILNFDSSYNYNIENEQNGTVAVDMQNGKIIFTPALQTTTPVTGGFSVYVSKAGETPSDSLDVSFEIYIPKLDAPVISGVSSKNWNEEAIFTIDNFDSNNSYVIENATNGSATVQNNQIIFTANPTSDSKTGSFNVKAIREHYLDSDSTHASYTITVPTLPDPILSGPANVNEGETLEITIDNFDSNNTYIVSKGVVNGDKVTYECPNVDTDTGDSITVKATREYFRDSNEVIFAFTIVNVPIVADNAIQIVDFDSLNSATNAEIQNGDIVATADNAQASVLSPTQEDGETDWVKYKNTAKIILPKIPLLDSTTAQQIETSKIITGDVNIIIPSNEIIESTVNFVEDSLSLVHNPDPFGDGSGVALYEFEGNANDTGGNYNGTWSGNEQYDTGKFGQGAKFDGGSYVDLGSAEVIINETFSIALWFKTENSGTVRIFGSEIVNDGIVLQLVNNDIKVGIGDGNFVYGQAIAYQSAMWTFACITYDNGEVVFVCNDSSSSLSHSIAHNHNQNFLIGADSPGELYFEGLIDQVRIFNRALTAEEIQILYTEEKKKYTADISSLGLSSAPAKVFFNDIPTFTAKTNAEEITQTQENKTFDDSTNEFEIAYSEEQPQDTFRQIEYEWSNIKKDTKITSIHTDVWKGQ